MQCNTISRARQPETEARASESVQKWEDLLQIIPPSAALEATARLTGALLRRREVKCAADLLRLVLAYACCDWSLRLVAIWCEVQGLGHLSANALRKRLKRCNRWLGALIVALLGTRLRLPARSGELRLRIQDATAISRPGSRGTDWRLHLSLNLGEARIDGIELTDAHGGETLARFPVQPGEIRLADSGHAHPAGLGSVLHDDCQIVVRINWQSLRLEDEEGKRFDVAAWLRQIERRSQGARERAVWLRTPQGRFRVRLIACPLPPDKAEEARRRARKASRKKKHNIDARTLLAAGFVLLLTNLPASSWTAAEVLELYRLRWQVEILIKRLKSLLAIDQLRAQDPDLAQTYLLGKLCGALLLEEMSGALLSYVPDDWDLQARSFSSWGVAAVCQEVLKTMIRGSLTLARVIQAMPRLPRLLSDGPRKRLAQWVVAQRLLDAMSTC